MPLLEFLRAHLHSPVQPFPSRLQSCPASPSERPHFHFLPHHPLPDIIRQNGCYRAYLVSFHSIPSGDWIHTPLSLSSVSAFTKLTPHSTADFEAQVKGADGPVIVDYFATWCGPCKAVSPILEKLSNEHTEVKFFKVDVDKLTDVAADNGISAMPTFQFYKGGEVLETVRGANPPGIQAGLAKLLA